MTQRPPDHACPVCGIPSGQARPWLSIPLDVKTGKPISTGDLVWCDRCDIGFMRRLPTPEEAAESYALEQYYTHGRSHFPDLAERFADRILIKLAYLRDAGRIIDADTLLAHRPGATRILDIGCGNGNLLASLAGGGRHLTGVEPDALARAQARKQGIEALDGTAEALPEPVRATRHDLVLISHVLEHCRDPLRALVNIREVLADDGIVYCEVPNCGAAHFRTFAEISEMLDVPRHTHFFTKDSLTRLCASADLQILGWHYNGYTRHFGRSWRTWENSIHRMLGDHGARVSAPRRTWASSYGLLLRSAFAAPERKYDCIGFFAAPARGKPAA